MRKSRRSSTQKRETPSWENTLSLLLASFTGMGLGVYADTPSAMIGGQTSGSAAYAAFVSTTGNVTPVSGLPASSEIYGVAINNLGFGLIGGDNNGDGYAAMVSPSGTLTPLSISFPTGTILSTAINDSNGGLIGGTIGANSGAYAAVIASDGTVTSLPLSALAINSVSLNSAGVGLIGGEGAGALPYATFVSNGTTTDVTGLSTFPGHLYSVAINDQGNGIIGGNTDALAYAAFVIPGGSSPIFLSPLPSTATSMINSVAINHSGTGLIGGTDGNGNAYAGYAAPNGTVTSLFTSPFSGSLNSVSLNDAGTGLVGGQNGSDLYAALVQPDGTVLSLISTPISGEINSVSINQAGVGLIGGQQGSSGYAALVAPNGTLTPLDVSNENILTTVALSPGSITNAATPQSVGSYLSMVYTQLAAAAALDTRFIQTQKIWAQSDGSNTAQTDIAHSDQNLVYNETDIPSNPYRTSRKPVKKNSIWVAPFGNYVHLKAQGTIPSYTNEIGGALLGYDREELNYLIGASVGYAFNYVQYSQGQGHSKIQEEIASFYTSCYTEHFRFTGVLWGGLYQLSNVRHTLSLITSTGKTHGWILDPHIELASPWAMDQKEFYFVEPFIMFDWVNIWQKQFTETGPAGFNLQMGSVYGSLLQSEAGLRFYQLFAYGWGELSLEEKVSYVNQAPFNFNSTTTSFVASASTFPIAVASTKIENLASLQLIGSFTPRNKSYPFGGFALQSMANASYQSYYASVFTGMNF